jgi:hypothetical protein
MAGCGLAPCTRPALLLRITALTRLRPRSISLGLRCGSIGPACARVRWSRRRRAKATMSSSLPVRCAYVVFTGAAWGCRAGPISNAHQSFVEMATPRKLISFLVTYSVSQKWTLPNFPERVVDKPYFHHFVSKVELYAKVMAPEEVCIPFTAMISLLTTQVWCLQNHMHWCWFVLHSIRKPLKLTFFLPLSNHVFSICAGWLCF